MVHHTYTVNCEWDAEAGVWYVSDTDVPGLATEAATLEAMERKLVSMVAELLELNGASQPGRQPIPFDFIAHKRELATA